MTSSSHCSDETQRAPYRPQRSWTGWKNATRDGSARPNSGLPGVNALGHYGRWAFAEFTDVFDIEPNLRQVIDSYSLTAVH